MQIKQLLLVELALISTQRYAYDFDYTTSPPGGVQSIVTSMIVCLFVCLFLCLLEYTEKRPNFTKYFVARSSTGGVATVMYFRFRDDVMFSHTGLYDMSCLGCIPNRQERNSLWYGIVVEL